MKVALCAYSALLVYTTGLANSLAKKNEVAYFVVDEDLRMEFTDDYRRALSPQLNLIFGPRMKMKMPQYWRRFSQVHSTVRRMNADVFHLQETLDPAVALAVKTLKVPVIVTVHDPRPHVGDAIKYGSIFEWCRRVFRKRADRIIVHAEGLKKELCEVSALKPEKVAVLPHGAITQYHPWIDGSISQNPHQLIFFGRLHRYKGLGTLMDAAPRIIKAAPDVKFMVAGRGLDLPAYREQMAGDPRFTLHEAYVDAPTVGKLFAQSAVNLLPYIEATQSGVAALGLAFGLPTVATRVGGLPEMIDDGEDGLIVPPNDPPAFAEAVVRLLKDDALRTRMADAAREKANGSLHWDTIAERTVKEVYKPAMEEKA